jgi:hypothetical protein
MGGVVEDVNVMPANGVKPGVKVRVGLFHGPHGNGPVKQAVQGPVKTGCRHGPMSVKMDHLPHGMNPCIGAASDIDLDGMVKDAGKDPL